MGVYKSLNEKLRILAEEAKAHPELLEQDKLNHPELYGLVKPKCPTCGSTNTRHITTTERATNAVVFGFLGNKRKYQFECLNKACGFKW